MIVDMKMASAGQTVQMTMTGAVEATVEPMAMHMDMTTDMGEMGSMKMQMYMTEEAGAYQLYVGMDDGNGATTWAAQSVPNADQMKQYGTETIEGKETVRYDGVITNEDFNEVFTSTGVMDQFSSLGVNAEMAQSMLTDLGDLPISVWVEKESNLPVKYEMDMTAMIQSIMNKTMEAAGSTETVTMESVYMTMLIHDIDNVESIEVPQEALDAAA